MIPFCTLSLSLSSCLNVTSFPTIAFSVYYQHKTKSEIPFGFSHIAVESCLSVCYCDLGFPGPLFLPFPSLSARMHTGFLSFEASLDDTRQ